MYNYYFDKITVLLLQLMVIIEIPKDPCWNTDFTA